MMKFILVISLWSVATGVFLDHVCEGEVEVLNCRSLNWKDFYEAERRNEALRRITFIRLTGQIDLMNLPNIRLLQIQFGNPDCKQLTSYYGLVVISGDDGQVFCQNDDSTTTSRMIKTEQWTSTLLPKETTDQWSTTQLSEETTINRMADKMTPDHLMTDQPTTEQFITENNTGQIRTADIKNIIIIIISIILVIIIFTIIARCIYRRCHRKRTKMDIELGTLRRYHKHNSEEEIHFDTSGLKNE